jgi:hypothetical protein
MRGWTSHPAWKEWSQKLAVATGDHFERELLPLLELLWPGVQQAPRLKTWDRQGIDLLVWTDSGPFPCVIQCKGFEERELSSRQILQIEESIDTFLRSPSIAKVYLVIHNRDGANEELRARVESRLEQLRTSGKAERAELWDRQRTVNELFDHLQGRLEKALHERSQESLARFAALFRFGHLYVAEVPAACRELVFHRDSQCEIRNVEAARLLNIPETISSSSGVKWTLLTGQFGTGKTTGAMRSAASSTRPILLVPCATVPANVFTHGSTNGLSQHIIDSLGLLPEPHHFQDLRRAAGAVLSYLLRRAGSPFVFILDGLDEHHFFTSLEGLQRLSNQLAEFSCAVVLTTRKEHLDPLLEDFNLAFSELGSKFGKRSVVCIDLEHWRETQTEELVRQAIADADEHELPRLQAFQISLHNGSSEARFGDLLKHPLFLHFILEDITSEEFSAHTRPALLRRWVARKLRRDRAASVAGVIASRISVRDGLTAETFVTTMLHALEELAYHLSTTAAGQTILEESASDAAVREIVGRHFGSSDVQTLPILLNSVLVIHSRTGSGMRVGFALRTLHEYLAAAYLVRNELDSTTWPPSVRSFVGELRPQA